jgi:hypothetical protein
MKKYIHYKQRHAYGVLISDKVDETKRGYNLGLEIECNCFESILKHMVVVKGVPYDIQNDVIMTDNVSGFKHAFMECMDVVRQFSAEKYIIVEHREDNKVAWYKKEVLAPL